MRNWSKEKTKQMEAVNKWCGYYRANPHRFAEDFLNIKLKIFQCILLVMMNVSNKFIYIAARGQLALLSGNTEVINRAISVEASDIVDTEITNLI